jgi:hypothetical protein
MAACCRTRSGSWIPACIVLNACIANHFGHLEYVCTSSAPPPITSCPRYPGLHC